MKACSQEYTEGQSRLTNLATFVGVAKLTKIAKILHQRNAGHVQGGTDRRPQLPVPSPNTFSTNTDGTAPGPAIVPVQFDPEECQRAKKELKNCVLELYK